MAKQNYNKDDTQQIELSDGTQISINKEFMLVKSTCHASGNIVTTVIENRDYAAVKTLISQYISPEMVIGKPFKSVDGDDIYIGIR